MIKRVEGISRFVTFIKRYFTTLLFVKLLVFIIILYVYATQIFHNYFFSGNIHKYFHDFE